MAKRSPCKPGKTRRRTSSGRMMCLPKKRAATKPKKKSVPKRRSARKSSGRVFAPPSKACGEDWYFDWVGGGYNSVCAKSRAEALEKARAKAADFSDSRKTYRVNESSIGRMTAGELRALRAMYD
jgi:hypothetical protein